jgi:glycerol-3-phosphate dehydrogenase
MKRDAMLEIIQGGERFDIIVVGGGASGAGIALDAASRGLHVCLLERFDFSSGTSSRSTKLVHGGVRYLRQGNISLVRDALRERDMLLANAPHLVRDLPFFIPCYSRLEKLWYSAGLSTYDILAGRHRFGRKSVWSRTRSIDTMTTLRPTNLCGGVAYHDGQFDDARLNVDLIYSAVQHHAVVLNYVRVVAVMKDQTDRIDAVRFIDEETGCEHLVRGRCVINATGAFVDELRYMDDPLAAPMVACSRGSHVVLDSSFLPGQTALMIPKTSDGRVLFAIPWHGRLVVGTTDVGIERPTFDPLPSEQEIDFILTTAGRYLSRSPTRGDVLSVFAGIRPLVRADRVASTARLSRDHSIFVSNSGLLTITGGKWTTYRRMAEDAVNQAIKLAGLPAHPCVTRELRIRTSIDCVGSVDHPTNTQRDPLSLTEADVLRFARMEFARSADDVLARRSRIAVLDPARAIQLLPMVARVLSRELGKDAVWVANQIAVTTDLIARRMITSP